MLSRKAPVATMCGLVVLFFCCVPPAAAQNTWNFGPGLGTLTYYGYAGNEGQCTIFWSEYYEGTYNYWESAYWNFTYNPDPSTGLASVPINGSFDVISGSMGSGQGIYDDCPDNTSGGQITYQDPNSNDGGLSGYTISLTVDDNGDFYADFGLSGYIDPKWEVLSILYAPAGATNSGNNNVDYTNSTLVSVTNSIDKTWSSNNTVSTSFTEKAGLNLPGFWAGKLTFSEGTTNSYTQGTEDDTSTTVSKTTSLGLDVKAGPSGYAGLDHDWDLLEVWVNPVTLVNLGNGGASSWSGYGFASGDDRSPGDMEVAKVNLGCLNGHWNVSSFPSGLGPSNLAQLLQQYCGGQTYGFRDQNGNWNNGAFLRTWASSENFDSPDTPPSPEPPNYNNASISPADFQTIGELDPWYGCTNESPQPTTGEDWTTDSNGSLVCPSPNPANEGSDPAGATEPNIADLEAEFSPVSTNGPVPYAQGQNFTGTVTYQDMDSQSTLNGKSSERSFGWEVGEEYDSNGKFWVFSGGITASVKKTGKETTTLKSNTTIQTQTTSTISAILGPPPNQGVDGCPAETPYPPGIAFTNYPEQQPDCGVPIPGDGPAYGQRTGFNVYEDNYFGSFLFSPVYY